MSLTTPIPTHGCLDVVRLEAGVLYFDGWVATFDAGPVDGARVAFAGQEFSHVEGEMSRPSPDVKKVHPDLDHAERCRFSLRVQVGPDVEARAHGAILSFTPLIRGREGCVLMRVIDPDLPLPPDEDATYIGGAFMNVSSEFLGFFVQRGGLQPFESVLDAGCGIGRMAYSLAYYLAPTGRYEGFDIVDRLIEWTQKTITPRFPNFHFQKVEVYNQWYNPTGHIQPRDFVFPYEPASFDFVFLTSVFTHMRAPEVRHYLDEIYRVLKPGGRCLATCFLLNRESERLIQAGKSSQDIRHALGECFTAFPDMPEHAIGYKEPHLLRWVGERRFEVASKSYGYWCGRAKFTSYQDMLVLRKPARD